MANTEAIWLLGPLALLLVGLFAFRRYRRRTGALAESQAVRAQIPSWISNLERLLWLLITLLIGGRLFRLSAFLHQRWGLPERADGGFVGLSVVGVGLIALPLAMLITNWISWIVPPLRKANLHAMKGSQVTFKRANFGLMKFALFSIPAGMLLVWISATQPWTR